MFNHVFKTSLFESRLARQVTKSSQVKVMTLTFLEIWKKSKSWLDFWMTWLDFSLKKWLSAQVCPYHKKSQNFFLNKIWQFIHQSKARVEFSRNLLLLNFFEVISGQKNLKNHVKICLFKWSFEISCFGIKISKKWRLLIILKAENHFANYILQNELLIVAFGCVLTVL